MSEEKSTKAHFIIVRGEKKMKTHRLITYKCNRSGFFKSKSTGKRQLKAQGSGKINKECSASLKVQFFDKYVEVNYFKEHNHETTLGHLPLPESVKGAIAGNYLFKKYF